jgi:phage shock protein E
MQMRFSLIVLIVAALMLAACGGAEAPMTEAPEAVAEASTELSLSPSVDVQTTADVMTRNDVVVLDVREQWEYDEAHIPGVVHLPMNDIPANLDQIPQDLTVIVSCRSGNRSSQVTDFLREQGYENVHNMEGGILAWQRAGLPVE